MSTIRNADKIAVFCDGEVAERGNHESLMKEEGMYYTLVTAQTGGDLQDELEAFAVSPTKVKHIDVEIDDVFPPGFERQSSHHSGIVRHGSHKINRQGSQLERQQSVKTGEEKEDVPEKKDLSEKEVSATLTIMLQSYNHTIILHQYNQYTYVQCYLKLVLSVIFVG